MKLIENATKEKLRGGFYTPLEITDFILKWGINGAQDLEILEPSCGDGVFIDSLLEGKFPFKNFTGIELDPFEYKKSAKKKSEKIKILNEDFHKYCNRSNKKFDLIIGNPPYIRYQYFKEDQQVEADIIFKKSNLKYSKLTNAWVSFVIGSSQMLKEKGKIGFVLPAEILQVSYAQQLRQYLSQYFNKINIISFEKLVFPDIQQEVVLLLCEKNGSNSHKIEHIELHDASELKDLDYRILKSPQKEIDFNSNKWTFYFLEQSEIDFLENISTKYNIPRIGDFAKVEVGITTGGNNYFTVPIETVNEFKLQEYAKPMVGRSVQVSSLKFTELDWRLNIENGSKANLLVFPPVDGSKLSKGARDYIAYGEELEINKGYKCGIRDYWYVVPSLNISSALFIRRNNLYPRLIINEVGAYTTDTMHRVYPKTKTDINALVSSYYNSLSFAFAEVSGRSHGGGVLELMPNEAESILLPYSTKNIGLLNKIDKMLRDKKPIDEILKFTDNKILVEGFGFSESEVEMANKIWKKLSQRRLNRS